MQIIAAYNCPAAKIIPFSVEQVSFIYLIWFKIYCAKCNVITEITSSQVGCILSNIIMQRYWHILINMVIQHLTSM